MLNLPTIERILGSCAEALAQLRRGLASYPALLSPSSMNLSKDDKNLFTDIPTEFDAEVFETLHSSDSVRIERILSNGHRTAEGFWYDQEEDEWVMLLKGSATLEFADGTVNHLATGDSVNIPAHTKHRVSRTSENEVTIWLAVFSKADQRKPDS